VQETLLRAWRNLGRFEGRSSLRSWLYRIATNVCLDMLDGRERRARPMDLGPAREPVVENLSTLPEVTWIEPIPDGVVLGAADPADAAVARETLRLAFVAALQHLPPRQRAVLILCEVLRWRATEVAELLETSVASVNSALQRARATLDTAAPTQADAPAELDEADRELLARYVAAFEAYDIDALTALIQEDATQSMPPFDLWLRGRDDIFTWWFGPGIGCKGSRVVPTVSANGAPAFGQYKPAEGGGYEPWALQVLQLSDGRIGELTFFLDTATLFPLFGLPLRLEA
jgi:RNA polymerase sigma-70 factor (ECF subfamily)